jgi:hypothetical protein
MSLSKTEPTVVQASISTKKAENKMEEEGGGGEEKIRRRKTERI